VRLQVELKFHNKFLTPFPGAWVGKQIISQLENKSYHL
jgi:hypothetical protein